MIRASVGPAEVRDRQSTGRARADRRLVGPDARAAARLARAHGLALTRHVWRPSRTVQIARSIRGAVAQSSNYLNTVPTSASPPTWEEDFTGYTSTANLLATPPTPDKGFWTSINADNTSQIFLDTSVGESPYTQSMRFDYPAGAGEINNAEYTIQRGYWMFPPYRSSGNPASVTEAWIEVIAKIGTAFVTANPNCMNNGVQCSVSGPNFVNPDFKFIFLGANTYNGLLTDRWEIRLGTSGTLTNYGPLVPGEIEDTPGWDVTGPNPADNQWHAYRMHFTCPTTQTSNDSLFVVAVDNTVILNQQNIVLNGNPNQAATGCYGVVLGQNLNQGVYQNFSIWWQRIRVWLLNPGWGY